MLITQGTTPTIICTLPTGTDLSQAEVRFTLAQGGRKITKSGEAVDVDGNAVTVTLAQEDTAWLQTTAPAEIQLNWLDENGGRGCSRIVTVGVERNLLPEVLA